MGVVGGNAALVGWDFPARSWATWRCLVLGWSFVGVVGGAGNSALNSEFAEKVEVAERFAGVSCHILGGRYPVGPWGMVAGTLHWRVVPGLDRRFSLRCGSAFKRSTGTPLDTAPAGNARETAYGRCSAGLHLTIRL